MNVWGQWPGSNFIHKSHWASHFFIGFGGGASFVFPGRRSQKRMHVNSNTMKTDFLCVCFLSSPPPLPHFHLSTFNILRPLIHAGRAFVSESVIKAQNSKVISLRLYGNGRSQGPCLPTSTRSYLQKHPKARCTRSRLCASRVSPILSNTQSAGLGGKRISLYFLMLTSCR